MLQFQLSVLLEQQGDTEGAINALRTAISLEPHNVGHHVSLARLLCRTGHPADAVDLLRSALLEQPENAMLLSELDACL